MTAVESANDPGEVGLRASMLRWWASLFQPTSVLTPGQVQQLEEEQTRGWAQDAACASADPEAWFPEKGSTAPVQVFAVCDACPVRRSCLASALLMHEEGVWAGTTAADRHHLYALLKAGAPAARVLDAALASQSLFSGLLEDVA